MLMACRPWSNRSSIAAVRIALCAFSLRGRPGARVFSAVLVTRWTIPAVRRCPYPAPPVMLSICSATVVEGRGTPSWRPRSSASRRSLCIMTTSNQAASGSSRTSGARACCIGDRPVGEQAHQNHTDTIRLVSLNGK